MSTHHRAGVPISDEHQEALMAGKVEYETVARYLDALENSAPRRRRTSPEKLKAKLAEVTDQLAADNVSPIKRLELRQRQWDLEAALADREGTTELAEREEAFVKVAASFGQRKGIIYAVWRELGVPAEVLRRAGIPR